MSKIFSVKNTGPGLILAVLFLGATASAQSWTSYTNYNQAIKLAADPVSPRLWGATPGGAFLFNWQDTVLAGKYDNTNGLPNVELTSVTMGRHGFKWFGTYGGGIARLDSVGSAWRIFNSVDGLLSDTVTALCSYQDYILAGTRQGLSFSFDGDSWLDISNNRIFPNTQAINAVVQRNDTIWMATDVGLAKADSSSFVDRLTSVWQRDSSFGLGSRNVQCIFLADTITIIGTLNGASRLVGTAWQPVSGLNGLIVRDIVRQGDSLFFATSQGIRMNCLGAWTTLSAGLLSTNAYSQAVDGLGRIWCGTELGLAVLQDTVWQPFCFDCLSENNCFRVACSQEGNPYVIRRSQKEIQYLHDGWWQTYNQANTGMPFSLLERLAIDKYGNLLAGDWGQGLFIRNSAGQWRQYVSELPTNVIKNILCTENGFYLAQWGHDYRDPVTFYSYADTMFHVYWGPIETMRPNALAIDGDGTLWVGTNAAGLYNRKTDGLWQNFNESNSALSTSNPVITMAYDNNGRLWVGTINGLFFCDGDKISPFSHPLLSGTIISIKVDRANNIWVGTDKGLNLITWNGQVQEYTQRDLGNNGSRLLSDNINEISIAPIDDQTDGIYIATEKGLSLLKYNLVLPRQALSVNVAPNPYRPGRDPYFYFSNLPSLAVVRIFTIDGRLLGSYNGPAAPEHILVIDPNDIGSKLVSGLYLCHVSAPGFKQTVCKLAVIR